MNEESYPPDVLRTWLTVDEYAAATGTSNRTVRRRLAEGSVQAGKLGTEWRIKPPQPRQGPPQAPPAPAPAPASSTALVPLDQVERLLAPYIEQQRAILAERDALRAQLDQQQAARLQDAEARRADAEELGRLRGRLEAVETELERSRQLSPTNPPTHPPASAEPPRRRWPWQR